MVLIFVVVRLKLNMIRQLLNSVHAKYRDLSVARRSMDELNNGRKIVGIVIKICALLQIFLPILENRELLTQVLAPKFMTIYYSQQNRPDKSLCVNIA